VTRPSAASVIGLAAANCGAVGRVLLDRGGRVVRARPNFGGDDASGSAPSPVPAFLRAPGLKEHRADLVSEGRHAT
jgi:hypothetical protein